LDARDRGADVAESDIAFEAGTGDVVLELVGTLVSDGVTHSACCFRAQGPVGDARAIVHAGACDATAGRVRRTWER
jgi:hypothetical protein